LHYDQCDVLIPDDIAISLRTRAVTTTRVARGYTRALFLSSNIRKNCKRKTAIKTGKPLAQTFVTQFRDKFSLVWDDTN